MMHVKMPSGDQESSLLTQLDVDFFFYILQCMMSALNTVILHMLGHSSCLGYTSGTESSDLAAQSASITWMSSEVSLFPTCSQLLSLFLSLSFGRSQIIFNQCSVSSLKYQI